MDRVVGVEGRGGGLREGCVEGGSGVGGGGSGGQRCHAKYVVVTVHNQVGEESMWP